MCIFLYHSGDEFHTREGVKREYNQKGALNKLICILNLFKSKGVKLEAVVNQYHIDIFKLEKALYDLDDIIKVDSICCLDEYLEIIYNHYGGKMYLVSSFNNKPIYENNLEKISNNYNMLVLSKKFMRRPEAIKKIKQEGFDIKLLVNNGCSFNCLTCRGGQNNCRRTFRENLKKYNPQELYAMQSFFPWELKELSERIGHNNVIDEIKLSSRPCTYQYLNNCLKSYIYNEDVDKYIEKDYHNYHLWGRQANLIPYFKNFNLIKIEDIKKELWTKTK